MCDKCCVVITKEEEEQAWRGLLKGLEEDYIEETIRTYVWDIDSIKRTNEK